MKHELFERVETGKLFDYYIGDKGTVFKRSIKLKRESPVGVYVRRGHAECKIGGKEYRLKNLVAKHHIRGYRKGDYVECKDGNPLNFSAYNLRIYTQSEHGKRTGHLSGRAKPVTVNGKQHKSIRQAAKAHYVSYQTLSDYIGGKVKYSVMQGTQATLMREMGG